MKYRKAPMFPREGAAAGREFPTMRSSRFNCERAGAHAKNEPASAALRKRITGKGKNGAGDRSRTGVASLGSWSMTVLLHPQFRRHVKEYNRFLRKCKWKRSMI